MATVPLRVLIVEDNPTDAKLLEHEMRRGGLEYESQRVETEDDYRAALNGKPDIVLCDWQLPQFDSYRALELLQQNQPNTPFILISGSIGEEAAVNVMKLGAADYLLKDRLVRLVPAIQHAIQKQQLLQTTRTAAAALQQSETLLSEAQHIARLGSWSWEPTTGAVWWSNAIYSLYGLDPKTTTPSLDTFQEMLHPEDQPVAIARVEAMMAGEEEFANDLRLLRPNGELVWIHSRARAKRDSSGAIIRVEGTDQDITERKKSEFALRESEERYRLAILATNDAVWDIDLQTGVVQWNERYATAFGRENNTSESWQWWIDHIHPDDSARASGGLQAALDGTADFWTCEYRFLRVDGVWADILDRAYISRDPKGRAIRVIGAMQDVTDRKRAEIELQRTSKLLLAVLNGTNDAVYVKDLQGKYLLINEAAARFVGMTVDEALGKDDTALFDHDTFQAIMERDRRVIASGVEDTDEVVLTSGGITRTFWSTKAPYRNQHGEVIGVIGLSRDVTDRKRLEEQFRQSQKMEAVGLLAGGVAHDFNNMLTVINGFSDMLLTTFNSKDPRKPQVEAILEAGERAAGLTAQLLAFSRKSIVAPKILDLNLLIDHLGKLLRRLIGEDILFAIVLSPGLARIKADPGQIEQVLMNLAVNSRDAMPRGGRLTIETTNYTVERGQNGVPGVQPGPYVRVRVTDTGCGMPPEVLTRIFDPFFTTKEQGKGTGLGLATVYGIVAQCGGNITVESEVNVGTTFTILIPATPEEVGKPAHAKDTIAPRGTETILLVEDEETVLRFLVTILKAQGYQVIVASNGNVALAEASKYPEKIDLVLTDVVMPGLGGRELAEAIRIQRPGIRVLYMSGYTGDAIVRYGIETAADAFIQKPITPLLIARKVREVLNRP